MRGNSRRWIAVLVLGCSGKSRPFSDEVGVPPAYVGSLMPGVPATARPGDMTAGSAESGEEPPLDAPLVSSEPSNEVAAGAFGAPCVTGAQCSAPGQCVDGVCCSSACTDLCAACDVSGSVGTCSAAPLDEACGPLDCAGVDTDCRKLDRTQLSLNCQGFDSCKVNADCAVLTEPVGTPCQSGAGTCDGAGACIVVGKANLGETCTADADCADGHCVAGADGTAAICCDAACDGACQACSADGHCDQTPATDARCEAEACPADDVCRDYPATVAAGQCRGFGQCQTARDCQSLARRPAAECQCDATSGACRLRAGAACAAANECASGACTANAQGSNVCCASACGAGLFCSRDGAGCVACEGSAVECNGNTERRCNAGIIATNPCRNGCTPGSGCNALPPLGFLCDGGQCAAPNVCQPDTRGASRCCSRNCAAEGKVCAENGSCACQQGQVAVGNSCLLQNGDPCQTSQQCQAGSTCTDGVCCQQACNGSCERCEPNTGLCVAVGQGQQDNQCNNGRQCNGARGDCRLTLRQPCSGNGAECTTNACEPTVGNSTQICCSQTCSGNTPFCRSNGQGCVQCETGADCGNGCNTQTGLCNALLPIGTPCGASAQCASGAQCLLDQTSQTRCCERNCASEGLLCNGAGRCVAPAPATLMTVGGAPPDFPRTLAETTSTTTRLWTVQNTGGSATRQLSLQGNAEFPTSGGCLNQVLQPGASCSLSIGFSPRVAGTRSATLTLNGGTGVALSIGVRGDSRLRDGSPCAGTPSLCDSGTCTDWFADPDGDGFGSLENVGGFPSKSVCGNASAANRPPPFIFSGGCRGTDVEIPYVLRSATPGVPNQGLDCCDRFFRCDSSGGTGLTPDNGFPGQAGAFGGFLACGSSPRAGLALDFNCDGVAEPVGRLDAAGGVTPCALAGCADLFNKVRCDMAPAVSCTQNSGVQGPGGCGLLTFVGCGLSASGACGTTGAGQITVVCR